MGQLPQRKTHRLKNYDYSCSGYYFITICTHHRQFILCDVAAVGNAVPGVPQSVPIVIPTAIGKMVIECWEKISQVEENISTDCFCLMPNHIHGIIVIENQPVENGNCNSINCGGFIGLHRGRRFDGTERRGRRSLPEVVRGFKSVTTRLYNKMGGNILWQKSYYEHIIRNEIEYKKIAAYIENNPAKWDIDCHNFSSKNYMKKDNEYYAYRYK